jgi:uncharacterized protein YkwD
MKIIAVVLALIFLPVISSDDRDVISEINEARSVGRNCGSKYYRPQGPVKWNGELAVAARRHANDMADKNYFSHTGKNGSFFGTRIKKAGYKYSFAGEVLAAGQTSPASAVSDWLKSPSHCRVLMNGKFKHAGTSHAVNMSSKYNHYWAVEFGRPQ